MMQTSKILLHCGGRYFRDKMLEKLGVTVGPHWQRNDQEFGSYNK